MLAVDVFEALGFAWDATVAVLADMRSRTFHPTTLYRFRGAIELLEVPNRPFKRPIGWWASN